MAVRSIQGGLTSRDNSDWLGDLRDAVGEPDRRPGFWRSWPFRLALVVVCLVVACVAGIVVSIDFAIGAAESRPAENRPTITLLSERQLRQLARSASKPIYWAGARADVKYELTRMPDGRIYLRYLPKGMRAGSSEPALTIATLPLRDAFAITRASAENTSAQIVPLAEGAVATLAPADRKIYLAYPGLNYQVMLSGPNLRTARNIASTGQIVPIP
jgi:hypothetical protein